MAIKLYNTLTKRIDEFSSIEPGKVNFFVCGPTVYDLSHLGHAKTYTQLDVLARMLRAGGLDVTYLQNITDIDDKIITRAKEQGISWEELTNTYLDEYLKDMAALGNDSVNTYARATDHIDDIIRQVQTLIDKEFAYTIEGDGIYFEIAKFPDYGKLSGRKEIQENDAQSRIDESDKKRGWNDFALWKFSKPGEPVWDAPFGKGRPGWHIEDTAITEHYFGPQYDIHGGAIDLIFPHHEAEITQMESASGKVPFVRFWTHTGFLNIESEKMSKSLKNFYTIREIVEKYDPMAVRLFMLQSHYRSSISFSFDNLEAAANRLKNWRAFAVLRHQTHDTLQNDDEKSTDEQTVSLLASSQALLEALCDDLNTPEGLRIIDEAFSHLDTASLPEIHRYGLTHFLETIDDLLGLQLLTTTPDISDENKQRILERQRARDEQDWAKSDELRDELIKSGIAVKDTPSGTVWHYEN